MSKLTSFILMISFILSPLSADDSDDLYFNSSRLIVDPPEMYNVVRDILPERIEINESAPNIIYLAIEKRPLKNPGTFGFGKVTVKVYRRGFVETMTEAPNEDRFVTLYRNYEYFLEPLKIEKGFKYVNMLDRKVDQYIVNQIQELFGL